MCIFAGHHRTVIIRAFRYFQQAFPTCVLRPFLVFPFGNAGIQILLFHTGIETTDYIHRFRIGFSVHSLSSFIVYGTGRIKIVQPSGDRRKIRSVTTFIPHAPHHYRRMIFIAFRHTYRTIQKSSVPIGCTGQCSTQSVLFYIRLIHHIQSQAVAQFIPTAHIGIVAGADRIHIGLFHQQDILQHPLLTHHACRTRIVLMAVHSAKTDGITVDQQLPVLYFYAAETYRLFHLLYGLSSGILQTKLQFV